MENKIDFNLKIQIGQQTHSIIESSIRYNFSKNNDILEISIINEDIYFSHFNSFETIIPKIGQKVAFALSPIIRNTIGFNLEMAIEHFKKQWFVGYIKTKPYEKITTNNH